MSLKKLAFGLTTVALLGSLSTVHAVIAVAQSEDVSMQVEAQPASGFVGDTVQISVTSECLDAGGSVHVFADDEEVSGDGQTYSYTLPEGSEGTDLLVEALCVDGDETIGSDATEIAVFGIQYVVTDPSPFVTGQDVLVTAGDFRPGNIARLWVYEQGGAELFAASLGTVSQGFSASATVVFPSSLKPDVRYPVRISDGEFDLETELTVGDPGPTAAPTTPTETPTSPSDDEDGDDGQTTSPSPTPTSTTGDQPGLPDTGR